MFHDRTISALCDTPDHICDDNIYDLYSRSFPFIRYLITFVFILISFGLLIKYINNRIQVVMMNVSFILILAITIRIQFKYSHTEMCKFPRWCHEGVNNTVLENSYFYRMNECPRVNPWLVSYYEDINHENYNRHCEDSQYGCCRVDNTVCDTVIRDDNSYTFYQMLIERHNGWFTSIEKLDERGSNCPTIEEIIYEVSSKTHSVDLRYEIYMINLVIIFINCYKARSLYFKRGRFVLSQSDIEMGEVKNEAENEGGNESEKQVLRGSA